MGKGRARYNKLRATFVLPTPVVVLYTLWMDIAGTATSIVCAPLGGEHTHSLSKWLPQQMQSDRKQPSHASNQLIIPKTDCG